MKKRKLDIKTGSEEVKLINKRRKEKKMNMKKLAENKRV